MMKREKEKIDENGEKSGEKGKRDEKGEKRSEKEDVSFLLPLLPCPIGFGAEISPCDFRLNSDSQKQWGQFFSDFTHKDLQKVVFQ